MITGRAQGAGVRSDAGELLPGRRVGAGTGDGDGGGLRKEDTALKDRLNTALKAVHASGEYDTITKRYFDFDIYGD